MRRSFDHLAIVYQALEYIALGDSLTRTREGLIPSLSGTSSVLILGEGDGRFLERLLQKHPACQVTVVEGSAGMMRRAKRRLGPREVEWVHGDARQFTPTRRYDAIVTAFFLDCFAADAIDALVGRLSNALVPGGVWLYADFHRPANGAARWRAEVWLWLLYRAFRLTTDIAASNLVSPRDAFGGHGLVPGQECFYRRGLLVSQSWHKPV